MPTSEEKFKTALGVLKKDRCRITKPRKALLQALISSPKPLSAEDAHAALGSGASDLVTVYRNLETFEASGIATRIPTEAGKSLFEFKDADHGHHHHHIVCRECHKTECLDHCEVAKLEAIADQLGYTKISHVLELYGICPACRAEKPREAAAGQA